MQSALKYFSILSVVLLIFVKCEIIHPGHMQKFGSSGPFLAINVINEQDPISTSEFFAEYVEKKVPVVFKNEAKKFPAYELWSQNDDQIIKQAMKYEDYYVNIETVKKESRDQTYTNMTFLKFLQVYSQSDIYLVNDVPNFLKQYVPLPTVLQCEQAATTLDETIMWYSSGGTKSVTHTDDYENILCLFSGKKTFILIDSYKHENVLSSVIDVPDGSYSSMDVDKVNYEKYPGLETVEYYKVEVEAGDCIYLPFKWIHQVDSFGRNIAVNFWFNYEKIFDNKKFSIACETNKFDPTKTLDKYSYSRNTADNLYLFRYSLLRQVNFGLRSIDQWKVFIEKELGDGFSLIDVEDFDQITKEVFDLLDMDGTGYIEDSDLYDMDDKRLNLIAQLFDELFTIVNKKLDSTDENRNHEEL